MYSGETDRDLEWTKIFTMNKDQQVNDGRLEADHMRLDYGNFMDDEEVTLLPHRKDTDDPNHPGLDIRDGPDTSDTQRDDWLLKTEPLQGARPRWTEGERPPMVDDRSGVLDLEAAGGVGGRKVEQHGIPAPLLSIEWQILQEEEVIAPPRGGRPAPEPQVPPGGARAVPQIFMEVRSRDGGSDRRKDVGSPVNVLVDTVARMQQDLANLRAENCLLRTPGVSQIVRAPRQAAFTTTKVPRFGGTTSWEQYRQVFDAIMCSKEWDNDTAALQLFSHLEGDALNVALLVPISRRLSRIGLVDALSAHYGSPGRLADCRRQFERTTRTAREDPSIFATALETLAVKAFGDIGHTARLLLIRDRFMVGHSSCELRRHLDPASPSPPRGYPLYPSWTYKRQKGPPEKHHQSVTYQWTTPQPGMTPPMP